MKLCGRRLTAGMIGMALLFCGGGVSATVPESDNFRLQRSVLPGGGGESGAGDRLLFQSIGQPGPVGLGLGIDGNHDQQAGFLAAGGSGPAPPLVIAAGEVRSGFRMISFTRWPVDSACEAVFGIEYDTTLHRIGKYDPDSAPADEDRYVECGDGLIIRPGLAYWVLAREGLEITYRGTPVRRDNPFTVPLAFNPDDPVHPDGNGWNMVAPPNDSDYLWGELEVLHNGTPLGTVADQAEAAQPVIDTRVWTWAGTYTARDVSTGPLLARNSGVWVRALAAGVSLRFPVGAQVDETLIGSLWRRAGEWVTTCLLSPAAAIADANDSPPSPPGGLGDYYPGSDRVDAGGGGGGGGCFIAATTGRSGIFRGRSTWWPGVVLLAGLAGLLRGDAASKRGRQR